MTPNTSVAVNYLFTMQAQTTPPVALGNGPHGQRLIMGVTGGTFTGPKLNGSIAESPGGEWATLCADGSMRADVRLLLETDDGATILMTYLGVVKAEGGELDIRTSPLFETGDERYAWLNRIQAVGYGKAIDGGVAYDVYELI